MGLVRTAGMGLVSTVGTRTGLVRGARTAVSQAAFLACCRHLGVQATFSAYREDTGAQAIFSACRKDTRGQTTFSAYHEDTGAQGAFLACREDSGEVCCWTLNGLSVYHRNGSSVYCWSQNRSCACPRPACPEGSGTQAVFSACCEYSGAQAIFSACHEVSRAQAVFSTCREDTGMQAVFSPSLAKHTNTKSNILHKPRNMKVCSRVSQSNSGNQVHCHAKSEVRICIRCESPVP